MRPLPAPATQLQLSRQPTLTLISPCCLLRLRCLASCPTCKVVTSGCDSRTAGARCDSQLSLNSMSADRLAGCSLTASALIRIKSDPLAFLLICMSMTNRAADLLAFAMA